MKVVNIIDVQEWDEIVEKEYGKPYKFQQQDGCKSRGIEYFTIPLENAKGYDYENDTICIADDDMGVSFKDWLERPVEQEFEGTDEWDRSERGIELLWHRNFYPSLEVVANDLYNKGVLAAGDYAIDIDW